MGSAWQTMQAVPNVYTLPRCDVSLRYANDDGSPGDEVWKAQQVDNIRVAEWFDVVVQQTTGIPYPQPHNTTEHHEITFDAIWNIQAALMSRPLNGPATGRNTEYTLVLTWQDAALGLTANTWYRRYYYGVTKTRRTISSRDANEFGSENVLTAKTFSEDSGTGEPPAI